MGPAAQVIDPREGATAMSRTRQTGPIVAASFAAALVAPALAVINPRFTPADLVRASARILLLEVSAPKDKALTAHVVETLKGAPPPQKRLRLELADDREVAADDLAALFEPRKSATAILLLAPPGKKAKDSPAGAIQIDTHWFAVLRQQGKWSLDRDKQNLFTVWAGSARMLAEATRYVLAEPSASFPVRSDITWGSDLRLGKLSGRANGCIVSDLGEPIGLCAIVLSDGGDRVYRATSKGGQPSATLGPGPADVTQKLKLTTASKVAAAGDFDGDARLDLACWDGKALKLARQTAKGTFAARQARDALSLSKGAARPLAVGLPECLSLDALDVGAEAGAGLLAGTGRGPVVLVPDGRGGFAAHALAGAAQQEAVRDLGPGGFCLAADFDRDGRCDVLQLFTRGTMFYGGEGAGRFKAPLKTMVALVKKPCSAVCGDYDTDGRLDVVVGGEDGLALLRRTQEGRWDNCTHVTGELAYHGNANQPCIVGAAPCDINNDGRQGVAFFYPKRNPMVFFNRGFACFGLAQELALSGSGSISSAPLDPFAPAPEPKLKAAEALQHGQAAGTMLDLNGDGVQDLLAVTPQGSVWALFGKAGDRQPLGLTVALPPGARGPVTISVSRHRRRIGMHVVKPGVPAYIGLQEPGPIFLEWAGPDGKTHRREVIVEEPCRVEVTP